MTNNLFVYGFDPIFLDIIITPLNDAGEQVTELPVSDHLTNNLIQINPGGNGLNVCKILLKLKANVKFVSSGDYLLQEMIKNEIPGLDFFSLSHKETNVTVALQFLGKETQLNSVKSNFGLNDINSESLLLLLHSCVIPFSNLGLNSDSLSLFEIIADYFLTLQTNANKILEMENSNEIKGVIKKIIKGLGIKESNESNGLKKLVNKKFDSDSIIEAIVGLSKKIFFLDTSTLKNFDKFYDLNSFLSTKFGILPGYKFISINTHEFKDLINNSIDFSMYLKNSQNFIIQHDAKIIRIYWDSLDNFLEVKVKKIDNNEIKTTVGSGDAFNAGFIFNFSSSFDLIKSVKFGINTAQNFIVGNLS